MINHKPFSFKKLFLTLFNISMIIILLLICINLYVVVYASPYMIDIDEIDHIEPKQTVMALGAKVWRSGNLSYILRDRVDYAVLLYQQEKVEKLLFSGDHGQVTYDEVNAMKRHAVDNGVPDGDIFLDHAGFSTYESMYRAKEVFECDDIIIVTQGFHLYRSVYNARKLGLNAIGLKSDQTNFIARLNIKNNLREFLARVKDFIYIEILRPKPTYLGDVIPISGDAYITHDE